MHVPSKLSKITRGALGSSRLRAFLPVNGSSFEKEIKRDEAKTLLLDHRSSASFAKYYLFFQSAVAATCPEKLKYSSRLIARYLIKSVGEFVAIKNVDCARTAISSQTAITE